MLRPQFRKSVARLIADARLERYLPEQSSGQRSIRLCPEQSRYAVGRSVCRPRQAAYANSQSTVADFVLAMSAAARNRHPMFWCQRCLSLRHVGHPRGCSRAQSAPRVGRLCGGRQPSPALLPARELARLASFATIAGGEHHNHEAYSIRDSLPSRERIARCRSFVRE